MLEAVGCRLGQSLGCPRPFGRLLVVVGSSWSGDFDFASSLS